ncbi:MAG: hypothetical protein AAB834_00155 [Patescibacteria group bacterium]
MKRLHTVCIALFILLCSSVTPLLCAPSAYANEEDEASLARVNRELEVLWDYVDNSSAVVDDQFYPEFSKRAQQAYNEVAKTYGELARTKETRGAKNAIETLRTDLKQIQIDLLAWRAAAVAADSEAFEAASFALSDAVDVYNEDIDAYNAAAYGTQTLVNILLYGGASVLAFMVSMFLFAWAIYRNHKTEDIMQEIRRKLRWRAALFSLLLVVGAAIPAYAYFFTEYAPHLFLWVVAMIGLICVAFTYGAYFRVGRLTKK